MTMFPADRHTHRSTFIRAWAKAAAGQPLEPVEAQIVQIAHMHPEYEAYLRDCDHNRERDFAPAAGETNPFLHMGLHIVILEQLSVDRPAGIRRLHRQLVAATGDVHAAEHRMMECLAQGLWRLQRDDRPFNEKAYLKCIRRGRGPAGA